VSLGFEWLHRLLSEPSERIGVERYLIGRLAFFWLILKQKLNLYKLPISEELKLRIRNPTRIKNLRSPLGNL